MDFLASTAIVIVGAFVFLGFVGVGLFGALATSPDGASASWGSESS